MPWDRSARAEESWKMWLGFMVQGTFVVWGGAVGVTAGTT